MKHPNDIEKVSLAKLETALFRIDLANTDPEVKKMIDQALEIVKDERNKLEDLREIAFMIANKMYA